MRLRTLCKRKGVLYYFASRMGEKAHFLNDRPPGTDPLLSYNDLSILKSALTGHHRFK